MLSETPTYAGYGFKSALDGDPNNNYVAGIENEAQAVVELGLDTPATPAELLLIWNDPTQFAKKVQVFGLLKSSAKFRAVRIVFSDFAGQSRILLKMLELR